MLACTVRVIQSNGVTKLVGQNTPNLADGKTVGSEAQSAAV